MIIKSFILVILVFVYTLVYLLAFIVLLDQSSTLIFYLSVMYYVLHWNLH